LVAAYANKRKSASIRTSTVEAVAAVGSEKDVADGSDEEPKIVKKKRFDVKPYLKGSAFKELADESYFHLVRPAHYGIAWPHEQDSSSDTII